MKIILITDWSNRWQIPKFCLLFLTIGQYRSVWCCGCVMHSYWRAHVTHGFIIPLSVNLLLLIRIHPVSSSGWVNMQGSSPSALNVFGWVLTAIDPPFFLILMPVSNAFENRESRRVLLNLIDASSHSTNGNSWSIVGMIIGFHVYAFRVLAWWGYFSKGNIRTSHLQCFRKRVNWLDVKPIS